MRDVPAIWAAWKQATHVGDARPCTRVTVERDWQLRVTDAVLGTWNRGPARWFQAEDPDQHIETEVPNVVSVNIERSTDNAGSCDVIITNSTSPTLGQAEKPPGQFGDLGYFTWDRGSAQDARARWGHVSNPWTDVLVPNALIRTYQGFGGHDKGLDQAIADGNIVLNGMWLVDDVTVSTDGTLALKCRDMSKLLYDQQLFPPLVPLNLYPLAYKRYTTKTTDIPQDPADAGDMCFPCAYAGSSTDAVYGQFDTTATGHRGSDAFDFTTEPRPPFEHQRTYWLSEPKGAAGDTVWIEFDVNGGQPGDVNRIYYHAWKGVIEAHTVHRVMVSVFENGQWVAPELNGLGGMTPEGVPYVSTFSPGTELAPETSTNLYGLPRTYRASRIRLTVTNLIAADLFDFGYGDPDFHGGGYRGGARKIMACFGRLSLDASAEAIRIAPLVFASAAIPVNETNRQGYWQVRASGQVFAFGDARVYTVTSPANQPQSTVIGMAVHPSGTGYWYVDVTGRVISAGTAAHYGDLASAGILDVVDIAPTPSGNGYWLLRNNGWIHSFGDATDHGEGTHSATMPSGSPALARSLESHPTTPGYWILWTDGVVEAFGLTHLGDANRTNFEPAEYVTSIRRTGTGNGYWITSGAGRVQGIGDAVAKGDASGITGVNYDDGNWYKFMCYDLIPSSINNDGYAIQHADGNIEPKGDVTGLMFGSVGSGKQIQRFDGNYKDYSDIIRELLLWAGFYRYKKPQPASEPPAIYGNIETTGAWADDDLPIAMFDKKPVIDAIREIRDIVGYVFFIDSEGAARFESPNWWTMGNFLIDGTSFPHMPEIDELVQLTGHQATFSGESARSELIIATEDPQPREAGQEPGKNITQTRLVPRTAPDLRGLIVPAMWTNMKFLKADEQKVMADLIDMRMWFARRTGNVECVGNPLIDVNDQVRVIERQTGEVFVHYITGISFSHDLESGDYTMNLTTHWLGGSPYGKLSLYYAAAVRPQGDGYWLAARGGTRTTTANAGVYAYGGAELYNRHQDDSHLEILISMRSTPSGAGYYTLDESGKVLTYGDAVHQGDLYRGTKDPHEFRRSGDVTDMALTPTGDGYWLLQKDGTVTGFGDAVHYGNANPAGTLPPGTDVFAHAIESHPLTAGYWVLSTDGTVEAFNLPDHGGITRDGLGILDYAARLRRTPSGDGYFIGTAYGTIHARGDAALLDADETPPPANHPFYNMVWALLVNPDGGYGQMRADGMIIPHAFATYSGATSDEVIQWALVAETDTDDNIAFAVSRDVMEFLAKTGSPSANNAVASHFAAPTEETGRAAIL